MTKRTAAFLRLTYHTLRLAVGLFFVAAAIGKLGDVAAFQATIGDFGLVWPPLIPATAWSLIVVEIAAGIALIFNRRGGLAAVTRLLLMFLGVLGYGLWRGLDIDCGCLGIEAGWLGDGDLRTAFWRDVVLLSCCGILMVFRARLWPPTNDHLC